MSLQNFPKTFVCSVFEPNTSILRIVPRYPIDTSVAHGWDFPLSDILLVVEQICTRVIVLAIFSFTWIANLGLLEKRITLVFLNIHISAHTLFGISDSILCSNSISVVLVDADFFFRVLRKVSFCWLWFVPCYLSEYFVFFDGYLKLLCFVKSISINLGDLYLVFIFDLGLKILVFNFWSYFFWVL